MRHTRHPEELSPRPRKKRAILALNIAVLMVLVGGTAAYGALSKTVTVLLDGRSDTVRTFSGSVTDVLESKDVELRPDDKLNMAKSGDVTDGDTIKVDFAKPVTVAVDGSAREGTVHDNTVGDVLDRYDVKPAEDAYVSVSRSARIPRSGLEIVVSNPKELTVKADGDTKKITSAAPRVEDALKEADVSLDKDDEVEPGRGALVSEGDKLKVTRIEMIDKTETVDVDPPVEYKPDADLEKGTTKVLEAGKPGKAREAVLITKADGKQRSRLVLTSEELEKPVKKVVARGTAEAPSVASNSVWDKIAQCESGGNWHINTGNGYYGGLQFSAATWHSVGGPGLPHQNSRETQIKYAKILQQRSGWGQWGCAHARFN
ncbi:transglycosylase family protein [Aeromicrobium sp.]|uniref:transglycosylase family protein n=1 Tax=Aeromicrobium sp. TaxID=1871063 RepID=UPI003C61FA24